MNISIASEDAWLRALIRTLILKTPHYHLGDTSKMLVSIVDPAVFREALPKEFPKMTDYLKQNTLESDDYFVIWGLGAAHDRVLVIPLVTVRGYDVKGFDDFYLSRKPFLDTTVTVYNSIVKGHENARSRNSLGKVAEWNPWTGEYGPARPVERRATFRDNWNHVAAEIGELPLPILGRGTQIGMYALGGCADIVTTFFK